MVPGWVPFKIVSDSLALHCKWPKLLYFKPENVPKFELYKHNDELFSMYDRIFYEL